LSVNLIETIKKIVEQEVKKIHTMELGIIESVFPHSSDSDMDNYECSVKLRDKDVELRKVPVSTGHIGLSNIPHVGDLVLVSFINGDINSPVITGRLYNDNERPPTSEMEEIVYKPYYYKENTKLRRLNVELPGNHLFLTFYDDRINLIVGKSSMDIDLDGNIKINSNINKEKGSHLSLSNTGILSFIHGNDGSNADFAMGHTGNAVLSTNPKGGPKSNKLLMDNNGIQMICERGDLKQQIIFFEGETRIISDKHILIEATKDNEIRLKAKKISLEADDFIKIQSEKDALLKASKKLDINGEAGTDIKSSAIVNVKGTRINLN